MRSAKNSITTLLKCCLLLAAVGGLYWLWHHHSASNMVMPDDDDISVMPRVPVHVGTITQATLHKYLTAFGTVEPSPARGNQPAASATITLPRPALVSQVNCIEGQHVNKGDPLFTIDPRNADLPAQKISQFNSPLSGTVIMLSIHPGEVIRPNIPALQVVDLDHLVIALNIPAADLSAVKIGQPAEIILANNATTVPATQPVPVESTVEFIDPAVDPLTNTGSVDLSIPAGASLHLNQWISARIITQQHDNCLVVPAQSIADDSQGHPSISEIVRDFRWAVRQPVDLGLREGNLVEVRSPDIAAGQDIVTTGAAALPDKSIIEVVK